MSKTNDPRARTDMDQDQEKLLARMGALANSAWGLAEAKNRSAANLRAATYTRRRAQMADNAIRDAAFAERIARALEALIEAHKAGDIPPFLERVNTRTVVRDLLTYDHLLSPDYDTFDRMAKVGIGKDNYAAAREWLLERSGETSAERQAERKRHELEMKAKSLIGLVPGFFPTPPDIAQLMLELAGVGPSDRVLDPSAGSGNLLDAAAEAGCASVFGIEQSWPLCEILEAKAHAHAQADFMDVRTNGETYDVVLMNPPFERGQDMAHVTHAMEFLRGCSGRLVAVVSEGCFFRQDRKSAAFRALLASQQYDEIDLPPGAFQASGTGVSARIIALKG